MVRHIYGHLCLTGCRCTVIRVQHSQKQSCLYIGLHTVQAKIFYQMFLWALDVNHALFQINTMKKIYGKNPPRGSNAQNYLGVTTLPATRLKIWYQLLENCCL